MLQLHNLEPLGKKRKRIARGGSRGGTSGRGHKGQKARSGNGKFRVNFEGGQMPLVRRLPKRGFNNKQFAIERYIISTDQLEQFFDDGSQINSSSLIERGLIKSHKSKNVFLVKLLAGASLTKKFSVALDAVSESAKKMVEASGGSVTISTERE